MEHITLPPDCDTINWFKAKTGEDGPIGGTKWMMLAEQTLREFAQKASDA